MELKTEMYLYIEGETEEEVREKRDNILNRLIKLDEGIDYQIFSDKIEE